MLHDPHDYYVAAIGNRIDIDFGRIFQKAIDQDRLTLSDDKGFAPPARS
jgi:hypothetical protein